MSGLEIIFYFLKDELYQLAASADIRTCLSRERPCASVTIQRVSFSRKTNSPLQPNSFPCPRVAGKLKMPSCELVTRARLEIAFKCLCLFQSRKCAVKINCPRHKFRGVRTFPRIMLTEASFQVSRGSNVELIWKCQALEPICVIHEPLPFISSSRSQPSCAFSSKTSTEGTILRKQHLPSFGLPSVAKQLAVCEGWWR